jgi:hypothetical protein
MKLETQFRQISREGGPQPRKRRTAASIVVFALLAASIAALSVTVVRQGGTLRDRDAEVATLQGERATLRERMAVVSGTVERLRARLDATAGQLRAELAATRRELVAMVGPALPDGRHFGRLIAVGGEQSPPRIVVDVEQWFTDQAAIQAAGEDGALPPENGYYIRNENPRWRVIEVVPGATVALTTYPFGQIDQPSIAGFERFTHLFERDAHGLRLFPYWITVRDGRVTAIEEQFIP